MLAAEIGRLVGKRARQGLHVLDEPRVQMHLTPGGGRSHANQWIGSSMHGR